jgi:hypothetical protein
MDFLKNFDYKTLTTAQKIGLGVAALIVLYIGLSIASTALRGVSLNIPGVPGTTPMGVSPSMGYGMGGGKMGYDYGESADYVSQDAMMPELSYRNAASTIYPPQPSSPTGDSAEEFEVTQYSASIETRGLEQTCAAFDELKKRTDVIFENANTSEHSCNYTFKVKHESVEGVLAWLKKLDPRELSENTYTIKSQIDDFTNETEILQAKRASIDATLKSALNAYDEITRLATNTQNADALAKIIDSKIQIIERLTQEKINIDTQLDRLSRAKAEQLDKLDYTYFYVNVYENKYIDGRQIGDSWKQAVREFVQNLNTMLQELTIGLVLFLIWIVQWLIYGVIMLVIAKYAWRFVKGFWNSGQGDGIKS